MRTRSQTNLEKDGIYGDFVFDFDESSREWNANKKKRDNGCYEYICGHVKSTGNKCNNTTTCGSKCRYHNKLSIE